MIGILWERSQQAAQRGHLFPRPLSGANSRASTLPSLCVQSACHTAPCVSLKMEIWSCAFPFSTLWWLPIAFRVKAEVHVVAELALCEPTPQCLPGPLPTGLPCFPLLTTRGSWCRSRIPALPSAKATLVQRPEPHFPKFLFREAFTDHFIKNSAPSTPTWRREWQPTPVFLPGEFHGQRSLAGYSPWGCKESDTT